MASPSMEPVLGLYRWRSARFISWNNHRSNYRNLVCHAGRLERGRLGSRRPIRLLRGGSDLNRDLTPSRLAGTHQEGKTRAVEDQDCNGSDRPHTRVFSNLSDFRVDRRRYTSLCTARTARPARRFGTAHRCGLHLGCFASVSNNLPRMACRCHSHRHFVGISHFGFHTGRGLPSRKTAESNARVNHYRVWNSPCGDFSCTNCGNAGCFDTWNFDVAERSLWATNRGASRSSKPHGRKCARPSDSGTWICSRSTDHDSRRRSNLNFWTAT